MVSRHHTDKPFQPISNKRIIPSAKTERKALVYIFIPIPERRDVSGQPLQDGTETDTSSEREKYDHNCDKIL